MKKKPLGNVMRSWIALGSTAWPCLLTSCATVDHKPELAAASRAMARATGLETHWDELPETRELTVDDSGRVPLETVIAFALNNNRSLRADLEVIGQAKADFVQSGLLSNPVLALTTGFPEGGGRANIAFGLSKDFADLWLIPVRKQAAHALVQQRVLSFTDTAITLLNETRIAYYGLQYQVTAIGLQEENLRILKESMAIAEARFRAGDTTQLDVNLVQARYVEVQNQLLQITTAAHVSRRVLLRLMGVSRASANWEPDALGTSPQALQLTGDETELVEVALLQRLDAQAARWELEAAVADFEQQCRRVIPSFMVGLSGERFERRATPGRDVLADTARASIAGGELTAPEIQTPAERREARSQEIDMILGPSFELPLPIFDQNQAQIAKARFRARELQRRYEEVEQRVAEGVRSAFIQRRLAEDRVKLFHESLLPLQEANLDLSRAAYQAGRESILTVLVAQEALIRTRLDFIAAVRDLAMNTANLERQLGGPIALIAQAIEPQP